MGFPRYRFAPNEAGGGMLGRRRQLQAVLASGDQALVAALRSRSEAAFREAVARHNQAMLRVARLHVSSRAIAEEVVQETWLAVLEGLDRFEGRSSFKTWMFRILVNRARTRGTREHRTIPFSSLSREDVGGSELAVEPDRFLGPGHRRAGHWAVPPQPWGDVPAQRAADRETRAVIDETISKLPDQQRRVITLRDVNGWSSEEVCDLLELSEGNQRVLLHRARSRVRAALENHLAESG
jgi:RNA polymerase sigma-70 factor (ECF subfamily)